MDLAADQRSLLSRYLRGPAVLEEAVADLRDVDLDAVSVDFPGPVPEHVWLCEELTRARITPRVMPPVDLSLRLGAMAGTRR